MRDLDLPRRLRLMGVAVEVVAGFDSRGSSTYEPIGAVNHHTASAPGTAIAPSLGVVINGRPDVPGPLCNVLQDRRDVARCVASGRANHGGRGSWRGRSGNSRFFGLEIEYAGTEAEAFPAKRLDAAARIQAAAALGRYDASMVCQHFEYAEPAGRKIDLRRAALGSTGPDGFRDRVQWYIDHPPGLAPVIVAPKPPPRLTKTLHVGDRDARGDENGIVRWLESLLLWNAVKRGQPNRGPGKVDGVFTGKGGTAESLVYFRRSFFDLQVFAGVPVERRVFRSREYEGVPQGDYSKVAVGPKTIAALEWAAAA